MARLPPPRDVLISLYRAAVAAAHPSNLLTGDILPPRPRGRTVVVGAGKPAGAMAQAFEAAWPNPCEGLVVTQYGYRVPTQSIEVIEADHPIPDQASVTAGRRILDLVRSAGGDDLIVALIAGGGSALLCLPAEGITLAQKQEMFRALLGSGAPIMEMNRVRRAMSAVKGGRLAAAAGNTPMATYMLSDVPGDDPATIGGGPTVSCPDDGAAALEVIARYSLPVTPGLSKAIRANKRPQGRARAHTFNMIATPATALCAAEAKARELGIEVDNLGDLIEGEARDVARDMARRVRQKCAQAGSKARRPWVLISGGETTVTLGGSRRGRGQDQGIGRGGRNTEFLLALALELDGAAHVHALACDTDGIDGTEDNAGAVIGPDILTLAGAKGLDGRALLGDNDAYSFFAALDALVVTGPTFTNVNDFRAILVT
ncbi:MAG: glycerate kinase [Alphaproteobacteria bacterium]|nr:glycerate kinase [Alphaproteobacteria bacterium]